MDYKKLLPLFMLATGHWLPAAADIQANLELQRTVSIQNDKICIPMREVSDLPTTFITEAEGTAKRYATSGYVETPYGMLAQTGNRNDMVFSSDGETVYIPNLIPNAGKLDTYLIGTLGTNEAGQRTLTVKANQLLNRYESFDEYMLARVFMTAQQFADQNGTTVEELMKMVGWTGSMEIYFVPARAEGQNAVLLDEYILTEDENGKFVHDTRFDPVYLFAYSYGKNSGYVTAAGNIDCVQVYGTICELPSDGVEWTTFKHQWDAAVFTDGSMNCEIGFKGDKVYVPGLVPDIHEAYTEGTIDEDGVITFPAEPLLFLHDSALYHTFVAANKDASYDAKFNLTYTKLGNYKMVYDKDKGTIVPLDGMKFIEMYCYDQWVDIYDHKYKVYKEDTPCVPMKPRDLGLYTTPTYKWFSFEIPALDSEGFNINPEKITYQCFMNYNEEDPYVFRKTVYTDLDEDMTEIPLLFTSFNYDFVYTDGYVNVYWYEPEWEAFGVRSVYTVNGVKNHSEILWGRNPESAVDKIAEENGSDAPEYDLLGRRVGSDYKGIVIKNNKKYIKR